MKKISIFLALLVTVITLVSLCACKSMDYSKLVSIQKCIDSDQDFSFFIISDPHYLSDELHDDKEDFQRFLGYGDKLVHYSEELLDAITSDIIQKRPDFMLLAGDILNPRARQFLFPT